MHLQQFGFTIMAFKFFHTPKPKKFNYNPRFYDERKEELENLKKKYNVKENSKEDYMLGFKDRLHYNWSQKKKESKREQSSTLRLILIIAVLVALTYWLIYS